VLRLVGDRGGNFEALSCMIIVKYDKAVLALGSADVAQSYSTRPVHYIHLSVVTIEDEALQQQLQQYCGVVIRACNQ